MKEIGVQTVGDSVSPRILAQSPLKQNEFPKILYQSHTVLWLQFSMLVLGLFTLIRDDSEPDSNYKTGILAVVCMLIFYCGVQFPDPEFMSRPHPALWKMLNGFGLCYLSMLIFLLFQTLDDSRQIFGWIDPSLGRPLVQKSYAEDCRLYTPQHPQSSFANLRDAIDQFVPTHAIGWFIKMLIFRDLKICWFLSGLFEFLEISLKHNLPNFNECWWDHLLLDFLGCNVIGMYLGYVCCKYCEMKEYHWGVGEDSRTRRVVQQFTPYRFSVYQWEIFGSCKNFVTTLWIIIACSLIDLGNFYLKLIFWIPPPNWMMLTRVIFWGIFSIISAREYYEYVKEGFKIRCGYSIWLFHILIFAEWVLIFKHIEVINKNEMPVWLQVTWTGIAGLILMIILTLLYKDNKK